MSNNIKYLPWLILAYIVFFGLHSPVHAAEIIQLDTATPAVLKKSSKNLPNYLS